MSSKFRAFSLGCVAAALSWSAQAAVVNLDFETIGLAAPSTGTAVGSSFSSDGLTFSADALAFHKGVTEDPDRNDTSGAILARAGNFGYVRSLFSNSLPIGGPGFKSFRIDIAGKNYDQFALTLGVDQSEVRIFAYDVNGNVLNTGNKFSFSNSGGFAWGAPRYMLVDGSAKTNIDHITFGYRGLFAIDDLQFTEAAGGGGTVPEPAGLGLVVLALAAAGAASRRGKSV